jgi:hypothetical protein
MASSSSVNLHVVLRSLTAESFHPCLLQIVADLLLGMFPEMELPLQQLCRNLQDVEAGTATSSGTSSGDNSWAVLLEHLKAASPFALVPGGRTLARVAAGAA